ncbi:MAG: NAD-dependent epimerase/dehydratase family protein [Actinobacteria bacterium]|nr:NAD-dependent epimerase/dehydratase family protein [Actinomycetota bacterium]
MRVVVTGATGNVGTSVLAALAGESSVESVLGIARRRPELVVAKTEWAAADLRHADLVPLFRGADAVIHLAWLIQPSRDEVELRSVNIDATIRVFRAVAEASVPSLVYASSVGAYSPGPKDRRVDEGWPTNGVASSFYARHKAEVERILDRFVAEHPRIRVARLRPGLIFKGEAAAEIRRLFAGPLLPGALLRPGLFPVLPIPPRLRFQAVHSLDVGDAYRLAALSDAHGAFNVAAEPILGPHELAGLLDARPVHLPPRLLRAIAKMTWRARLQPTPPGWVDMALAVPLMDTRRAKEQLGWHPRRTATEALMELVDGMRHGRGAQTPPLAPHAGGRLRLRELATGVGARGS